VNRTDRLLAILLRLQSHGHASAADLARHFEVSRRTILRDMEALSTMSVPLEAESGPGGGFRLMRGYFLPPLVFEQAEAWTLLTGVRSLLAHGGVPHREALVRAADKIAALLDARTRAGVERMASRVGVHVRESDPGPYLDAVAEAVVDGQALVLTYNGPEGEAEREVDPYLLYSQGGVWYLQGFCHLRQAIRIFRTDRIRTLHQSGRRFTPPPDQDVADPFAYRRAPDGTRSKVRLRLSPEALRQLEGDREWAPFLQPDGTLVRGIPPHQFPFITRLLLSFGPGIVVEEPAELREMLRESALKIAAANGESR
jgi:predicted DNA-binding transcriptional regulator YafY